MTRILLSGCCGKMGRNVISVVNARKDCEIVAGIDIVDDSTLGFPVFQKIDEQMLVAVVHLLVGQCLVFQPPPRSNSIQCSTRSLLT